MSGYQTVAEQLLKDLRPARTLLQELSKKFSYNEIATDTTGKWYPHGEYQYVKGYLMSYPTIEVGKWVIKDTEEFVTVCYAAKRPISDEAMAKWMA